MQFTPKTAQEIENEGLWPAGDYTFEVVKAENCVSKKGNEMIKLMLEVYNSEGHKRIVFDYLMEAMAHKLRSCCETCGLMEKYNQGCLEDIDFKGKSGMLRLIIQKDKTGEYSDKNSVASYLANPTPLQTSVAAPQTPQVATSPQPAAAATPLPDPTQRPPLNGASDILDDEMPF